MDLNSADGASRFEGLLNDMADLTVGKFNGSLKAEHGTGRNMAPFVQYEWGGDLYDIMWRIKILADPNHILNPDVLLTKDDKLHIKNLKQMPIVSNEVDLCVECGFCEQVCPSSGLTMTPRQRIAIQREVAMGHTDSSVLEDYAYDGVDTCATDGLCEIACPVNINTGSYIKSLRQDEHSSSTNRLSLWAANHFDFVQSIARFGLTVGKGMEALVGTSGMRVISKGMHHIGEKTGQILTIPNGIQSTCCSQPFSSKGYADAAALIQEKAINLLWSFSKEGTLPIVVDTSPCTYQFLRPNSKLNASAKSKLSQLKIVDIVEYLSKCVTAIDLPKLQKDVALHPTCSTEKMGDTGSMEILANAITETVHKPIHWGCCGFAGDKGMNTPELNQSAVKKELNEVEGIPEGYSTSRTCEMGMSGESDPYYRSLAYLVHEYLNQPVN